MRWIEVQSAVSQLWIRVCDLRWVFRIQHFHQQNDRFSAEIRPEIDRSGRGTPLNTLRVYVIDS